MLRYLVLLAGLTCAFGTGATADASAPRAAFTFVEYQDNGFGSDLSAVLWVVNQDGSGLRRLTDPFPCVDCASAPRFSPDGRLIAYGGYFDPASLKKSVRESEVGAIGVDGKHAHPAACSDCSDLPAWSPDGKRIAATAGRGIVVSDYPTGQHRRLVRDSGPLGYAAYGLDWTRDGKWFTYSDVNSRIHVMRADGSHAARIAADAEEPRFAPDGRTILFTGRGGWLYLIPRGGGKPKRLTVSGSGAWSSDGARIASIDGRTITILDLKGGHKQRLMLPTGMCVGGSQHWCDELDWHS